MSLEPTSPHETPPAHEPRSRAVRWLLFLLHPKVAVPLLLIFAVLAAPFAYRGYRISRVPDAPEPFYTQPLLEFVVPDADNAFVEYRAATAMFVEFRGDYDEVRTATKRPWSEAPADVRKWLDANRPALDVWRKGTAKPDAQYERPDEVNRSGNADGSLRDFANLAVLESMRLQASGELAEAWEWLLTTYRAGNQVARHADSINLAFSTVIHDAAADGIIHWAADSRITTNQLRQAIADVKAERLRKPSVSSALMYDYLSTCNWIRMESSAPYLTLMFDRNRDLRDLWEDQPTLFRAWLFTLGEPDVALQLARHVYTNWLTQTDHHRRDRVWDSKSAGFFVPSPAGAKNSIAPVDLEKIIQTESIMARTFLSRDDCRERLRWNDYEQARDDVLQTALAIQVFQRRHARYPDRLDELVPEFFPAVPEDLFAPAGAPLRYRLDFDKSNDIGFRLGVTSR